MVQNVKYTQGRIRFAESAFHFCREVHAARWERGSVAAGGSPLEYHRHVLNPACSGPTLVEVIVGDFKIFFELEGLAPEI